MITLKPATNEVRPRDRKRKRWVLTLGRVSFHLTPTEVRDLVRQGQKADRVDALVRDLAALAGNTGDTARRWAKNCPSMSKRRGAAFARGAANLAREAGRIGLIVQALRADRRFAVYTLTGEWTDTRKAVPFTWGGRRFEPKGGRRG